jgi:hypothetical protein
VDLGDADNEVSFRADRVYTPWTMLEVERWLINEPALEPALVIERPRQSAIDASGRLRGRATARHRNTGGTVELLYAIVDIGEEKVIARFVGPAEQVAFNRSVLDAALAAFDADALLSNSVPNLSSMTWTAGQFLGSDAPVVSLPSGWLLQQTSGVVCSGLPPPGRVVSVSPPGDFTLSLRLAWWPDGTADAKQVASACGGGLGDQAPSVQRTAWAGVQYVMEGVVRTIEGGVVQLAVIAPSGRLAAGRAIFEAWARPALR